MRLPIRGNYFNGNFHHSPSTGLGCADRVIKRFNPAHTESLLWECPIDFKHIDLICESVQNGFHHWKKLADDVRVKYLKRFQAEIVSYKEELANALSIESGRPLWDSRRGIEEALLFIDYALNLAGNLIPENDLKSIAVHGIKTQNSYETKIHYKPIGPCLIITPFCSPLLISIKQVIPTLLAGNSVVIKPSEKACYTADLLVHCFHKAEFPSGVINLYQGDDEAARRLLREKTIRGVFFTGSEEHGREVQSLASQDLSKIVVLNLGHKNISIIDQDQVYDKTVNETLFSAFHSAGQICTKTSIVAINKKIAEEFITQLHKKAKNLIIDHPMEHDKTPFMGPLSDARSVDNYLLFIGMAKREGHEEIMRGKVLDRKIKGHYVSPSIHLCDKWPKESLFLSSEIFGPNVVFIPYESIDEAIVVANKPDYGLYSSIYSNSEEHIQKCLEEINCGTININCPTSTKSFQLPHISLKNSGNHRSSEIHQILNAVYPLSSITDENKSDSIEIIGLDK